MKNNAALKVAQKPNGIKNKNPLKLVKFSRKKVSKKKVERTINLFPFDNDQINDLIKYYQERLKLNMADIEILQGIANRHIKTIADLERHLKQDSQKETISIKDDKRAGNWSMATIDSLERIKKFTLPKDLWDRIIQFHPNMIAKLDAKKIAKTRGNRIVNWKISANLKGNKLAIHNDKIGLRKWMDETGSPKTQYL